MIVLRVEVELSYSELISNPSPEGDRDLSSHVDFIPQINGALRQSVPLGSPGKV